MYTIYSKNNRYTKVRRSVHKASFLDWKKIICYVLTVVMLVCSMSSYTEMNVFAEETSAHTINVFDISIKQGADYYSTYTPDNPSEEGVTSLSDAYVWQAENANEGHKFVYSIKVSVSGEGTTNESSESSEAKEAVGEGFIKIRIPAHILMFNGQDKAGVAVGGVYPDSIELPVPDINKMEYKEVDDGNGGTKKIFTTDHQFVYEYHSFGGADQSEDYVEIYNIKPVSAGVVYEFPVAYTTQKKTWEYKDLQASEALKASLEVASWEQGNVNNKQSLISESREIPVYIDTTANIESTTKRVESTLLTADQAKSKTGVSTLSDDYKYVIWSVTTKVSDVTQKYNLNLSDTTTALAGTDNDGNEHTVAGEVCYVKMNNGYIEGSEESASGLTNSGNRVDYVITRYKASEVAELEEHNGIYSATNDVAVKLTPSDGQDGSKEKVSQATLKYEVKDPVWKPIAEKYTSAKYGLYNNAANRVTGKNNVTSYELSKLLDDQEIANVKYETVSSAHAYGKTVENLNNEIKQMVVGTAGEDGITIITAGNRVYEFNGALGTGVVKVYDNKELTGEPDSYEVDCSGYASPLTSINMQRIAADDIAAHYYGQNSLTYTLEDKTFALVDKDAPSESTALSKDDIKITDLEYNYIVKNVKYDSDTMEFDAGEANADLSNDSSDNILNFYVYSDGSDEPILAGKYNIKTKESFDIDNDYIKTIGGKNVIFADNSNITGYKIETTNKYFYVELNTKPNITLKPSDLLKNAADELINGTASEKKIAIKNTDNWRVTHEDGDTLYNADKSGIDYIADIIRTSDISKTSLGELVSYKGQDGKTYKSQNDTLIEQYQLAWSTKISEVADGVEVDGVIMNNVPVPQQSGIFYDLLPLHSDIIEGSVNVYVDASGRVNENTESLPASSFEVLDRIDDYNGSGRKLLIIKVNAPCEKSYTVNYVTTHAHADIQDYGSFVLNTVAYQTGNADIGEGYPDDGGNYAVSLSNYLKNLDPDNGDAKRFIYAEKTEDILALFPTSSGIYKKVTTKSDPTYKKSGVVHNGEIYTYTIRMQNDSETKARDIAIMDSIENYRTVDGVKYNSGLAKDRDFRGVVSSINLSGIEEKISDYIDSNPESGASLDDLKLIVYVSEDADGGVDGDIVNLEDDIYSDSEARKYLLYKILGNDAKANEAAISAGLSDEQKAEYDGIATKWQTVDYKTLSTFADIEKVTAFIVYTGENYVLDRGASLSFAVNMKAPDEVEVTGSVDAANGEFINMPATYNNVYRSFTTMTKEQEESGDEGTYFYTHYDYTEVKFLTVGQLKFKKADTRTKEGIEGVKFNLVGTSDYGTKYDETVASDGNGYVLFKNLERGTYTLIETESDADHLLDTTARTVQIDDNGNISFIDPDEKVDNSDETTVIYNEPRYHGDLEFTKVDALSKEGILNTKFVLNGTSDYNTTYKNLEAVSDGTGRVVWADIEKGTYTITETRAARGYLPPIQKTYNVTSTGGEYLIFEITGENVENTGDGYVICNDPTVDMNLQKVDSITKATLDDAKFTLKADNSLNDVIENLIANSNYTINWEKSGDDYIQTIDGGLSGRYVFTYLPEGSYTLTEDRAPAGYKSKSDSYEIKVVKNSDGTKLVIELPETDDMQYFKLENGDFKDADKETATYYRLLNDQSYEDGKTLIKSWIGDIDNENFPIMHLSTEKPQADPIKTTIYAEQSGNSSLGLRKLVNVHRAEITGFERHELPEGVTPERIKKPADSNNFNHSSGTDTSYEDEEGIFYAWWDDTDKKIYWWSDADIIYMPPSCAALFEQITNSSFTTIDLSAFDFTKVEDMRMMFKKDSTLQSIIFPDDIETPNLKYMGGYNYDGTFSGCSSLTSLDLSGFDTSQVVSMEELFRGCEKLETIDVSSFRGDSVTSAKQMFADVGKSAANKDNLIIDLKNFNTPLLTTANSMFLKCAAKEINLASMDTINLIFVQDMFKECYSLKKLTIGKEFKLNAATDATFNNSDSGIRFNHLTHLEVFEGSQYLEMKSCTVLDALFQNIGKDAENKTLILNLNGIEGNGVTRMNNIFRECGAKEIDISNLNTDDVTGGAAFFTNCQQLEKLTVGENFKLNGLTKFGNYPESGLFLNTYKLKEFNGSQYIELANINKITDMFQNCAKDVENSSLVLNLSGLKAANATEAISTFNNCNAQTIILSNFDTSNITNMNNMFKNCKVRTIYVGEDKWDTSSVTTSTDIFSNCSNIVGGAGTTYRGSNISYAIIDGTNGNPGYLTNAATLSNTGDAGNAFEPEITPLHLGSLVSSNDRINVSSIEKAPVSLLAVSSDTYAGYTAIGDETVEDPYELGENERTGKVFEFEYITAKEGSLVEGETNKYKVKETIYMTVTSITKMGEDSYKKSIQKYEYTQKEVYAIWTKDSESAPAQWKCEMQTQNADDEFFAWEDEVDGFKSTATSKNPIKTLGRDDEPVITNSTTPVGNLELKKTIQYGDGNKENSVKYSDDEFCFKVEMKNADNTPYAMDPFDESGIAYFFVKPNVDKDDKVIIRGIPEGCTYTVTEINNESEVVPDGYTFPNGYGIITTEGVTGSIAGNITKTAEIKNEIDTKNLTLTKEAKLYKKDSEATEYTEITDASDEDLADWVNEDFTFEIKLYNLIKGKEYSYKIGDVIQTDKIIAGDESDETVKEITIKGGQSVTIMDIPTYTAYVITETTGHEDADGITYEISYKVEGGNKINATDAISANAGLSTPVGDDKLVLKNSADDTVTFANVKKIDEKALPEYVSVEVNKKWYDQNGNEVTWSKDEFGNYIKDSKGNYVTTPAGNYPSFLTVELGRVVNIGTEENPIYDTNTLTNIDSYSLKANEDWSHVFDELPKYAEMTMPGGTVKYPYVYFITEIVPIGFENSNDASDNKTIGTGKFFVVKEISATEDENDFGFTLKNKAQVKYELSVAKLVEGNMGNKARDFEFEISFKDSSGKALTGTGFTVRFTDLYDSSYSRNRTYTLETGKADISLSHGMMVTFLGLPSGTQYTIKEKNANDYNVKSGTYTVDGDVTDATKVDKNSLQDAIIQVGTLSSNTNYLYVNSRKAVIPTGVRYGLLSLIMLGLVSAIGYRVVSRKRRKDRDDENIGGCDGFKKYKNLETFKKYITKKKLLEARMMDIGDKDFFEFVEFIEC